MLYFFTEMGFHANNKCEPIAKVMEIEINK